MNGACLHCGKVGKLVLGACATCIAPHDGARGSHEADRLKAAAKGAKKRARERKAASKLEQTARIVVVAAALAAVPAGLEQRLVVDWVTGRVAGAVVYDRHEAASAVEDTHRAACVAAGVWTPAVGRMS